MRSHNQSIGEIEKEANNANRDLTQLFCTYYIQYSDTFLRQMSNTIKTYVNLAFFQLKSSGYLFFMFSIFDKFYSNLKLTLLLKYSSQRK